MAQVINFPPVPTHTPVLKSNRITESKRLDLLRKQANISAIKEQLKSDNRLDRQLAEVRRQEEVRQRAAREQEAIDEAELFAEFEKLEQQYPEDCKKNKDGKCTIMGGKYKSRKIRTNKRKSKRKYKNIKRKTYRKK
jgi:hypothetical protein